MWNLPRVVAAAAVVVVVAVVVAGVVALAAASLPRPRHDSRRCQAAAAAVPSGGGGGGGGVSRVVDAFACGGDSVRAAARSCGGSYAAPSGRGGFGSVFGSVSRKGRRERGVKGSRHGCSTHRTDAMAMHVWRWWLLAILAIGRRSAVDGGVGVRWRGTFLPTHLQLLDPEAMCPTGLKSASDGRRRGRAAALA